MKPVFKSAKVERIFICKEVGWNWCGRGCCVGRSCILETASSGSSSFWPVTWWCCGLVYHILCDNATWISPGVSLLEAGWVSSTLPLPWLTMWFCIQGLQSNSSRRSCLIKGCLRDGLQSLDYRFKAFVYKRSDLNLSTFAWFYSMVI